MSREAIITQLQQRLVQGETAADLLRFLTLEEKIEDQIELMQLFCDAFDTNLGSVTAIGGWWYELPRELDDEDVNAYIQPVLAEYLAAQ